MFLLGAALIKLDFFDRKRRRWHWLMFGLGIPVGVAGELLFVRIMANVGDEMTWGFALADPLHQLSSLALCLGYVGGITLLASTGALRFLTAAFAAVGRLALSNYLLQSIVTTSLMYWWGLAWFDSVSRPQQVGLVVAIYAGQVLLSVLWMRIFTIGPFEWLWRSLTYLKVQPFLRR
jgi:uncharacterized protein